MNHVVAGLIWACAALTALSAVGWCALEAYTYFIRSAPITIYVRNERNHYQLGYIAFGIGLVAAGAVAFTHFVLDGGH